MKNHFECINLDMSGTCTEDWFINDKLRTYEDCKECKYYNDCDYCIFKFTGEGNENKMFKRVCNKCFK